MHGIAMQALVGEDFILHKDEVWSELVTPSTTSDELTLQFLFKGFSTTTQRLLFDHLPGGKYHPETEDIVHLQDITSVPTVNTSPERDFAILDRLLREKPNAKLIAIESMMMYRQNKTACG